MIYKHGDIELEVQLPPVRTLAKLFPDKDMTVTQILRVANDLITICCPVFQDPRLIDRVFDVLTLDEIIELVDVIAKETMNNETNHSN